MNCLHSFITKKKIKIKKIKKKKKIESHKNFVKIIFFFQYYNDFNWLEFNQYQKSDKKQFIIYADIECLIEKIARFKGNPENLI